MAGAPVAQEAWERLFAGTDGDCVGMECRLFRQRGCARVFRHDRKTFARIR